MNGKTMMVALAQVACAGIVWGTPLTGEEILAKPRAQVPALELPEEGIFFGPATYGDEPTIRRDAVGEDVVALCYAGHTHCRWVAGQPAPHETIALTKDLNQGNVIQFWQTGEKLFALADAAAKAGLYSMNIYAPDDPAVAKRLCGLGRFWLGHDSGEIFRYREGDAANLANPTLKDITDAFMRRVHEYVSARHASGWGNVLSTGGDFSMDLQVAAGIDIPLTEDYPFRNQLVSSALERGVARQYGLKLWGTHQAHEWNAFIPYANPLRQPLLGATFQIKYMTGAKIIINESGNWEVQTTLCEDSPMHRMPHVNPCKRICGPDVVAKAGFDLDAATVEARKSAHLIGWKSEVSQEYRKVCSDFWDFVKENPAPKGQPEATIAVIKGNYDLSGEESERANPIGGAQKIADRDSNWYPGDPEDSWRLVKEILAPRPEEILYPSKNFFLGGSPYGQFDITSFAYDNTSAEFLLKHYKALMFAGWNTCSPKQYRILCDYVKGGGRLLVAIPHLSCDVTRKYTTFTKDDLVNGGDFSELCGVRVKGRGPRVWWATAAEPDRTKVNALGIRWPRRYGILALMTGDLEYTLPAENYEKLAVEDEGGDTPLILRVKRGKGEVFFVNTWCYPSVADKDEGPGASFGSKGLMTTLYAYVARISRGSVYIDGVGQDGPDRECDYVVCSYFPEDGRTFLKNVDFRAPHRVDLVRNGKRRTIVLAPAEMRIIGKGGADGMVIRGLNTCTAAKPQRLTGKDGTVFTCGVRPDGRFHFRFDVKDDAVCVAKTVKHPLDIANGDRVEVYFVPDAEMKAGYRCAEIDAEGTVLSYSVDEKKNFDWFWKFETLESKASRTTGGYTVEGSVAVRELESFGVNPKDFYLGVFRADMSEPGKVATWCSGAPMLLPAHFHQPAMLMHCSLRD